MRVRLLLAVATVLVAFGSATAWAQPVHVAVAANFAAPMKRLAAEAQADRSPERGATAQRVFEYLMAAVGLAASFFGLGGLLATLARIVLAPDALGSGWRDPLSPKL